MALAQEGECIRMLRKKFLRYRWSRDYHQTTNAVIFTIKYCIIYGWHWHKRVKVTGDSKNIGTVVVVVFVVVTNRASCLTPNCFATLETSWVGPAVDRLSHALHIVLIASVTASSSMRSIYRVFRVFCVVVVVVCGYFGRFLRGSYQRQWRRLFDVEKFEWIWLLTDTVEVSTLLTSLTVAKYGL